MRRKSNCGVKQMIKTIVLIWSFIFLLSHNVLQAHAASEVNIYSHSSVKDNITKRIELYNKLIKRSLDKDALAMLEKTFKLVGDLKFALGAYQTEVSRALEFEKSKKITEELMEKFQDGFANSVVEALKVVNDKLGNPKMGALTIKIIKKAIDIKGTVDDIKSVRDPEFWAEKIYEKMKIEINRHKGEVSREQRIVLKSLFFSVDAAFDKWKMVGFAAGLTLAIYADFSFDTKSMRIAENKDYNKLNDIFRDLRTIQTNMRNYIYEQPSGSSYIIKDEELGGIVSNIITTAKKWNKDIQAKLVNKNRKVYLPEKIARELHSNNSYLYKTIYNIRSRSFAYSSFYYQIKKSANEILKMWKIFYDMKKVREEIKSSAFWKGAFTGPSLVDVENFQFYSQIYSITPQLLKIKKILESLEFYLHEALKMIKRGKMEDVLIEIPKLTKAELNTINNRAALHRHSSNIYRLSKDTIIQKLYKLPATQQHAYHKEVSGSEAAYQMVAKNPKIVTANGGSVQAIKAGEAQVAVQYREKIMEPVLDEAGNPKQDKLGNIITKWNGKWTAWKTIRTITVQVVEIVKIEMKFSSGTKVVDTNVMLLRLPKDANDQMLKGGIRVIATDNFNEQHDVTKYATVSQDSYTDIGKKMPLSPEVKKSLGQSGEDIWSLVEVIEILPLKLTDVRSKKVTLGEVTETFQYKVEGHGTPEEDYKLIVPSTLYAGQKGLIKIKGNNPYREKVVDGVKTRERVEFYFQLMDAKSNKTPFSWLVSPYKFTGKGGHTVPRTITIKYSNNKFMDFRMGKSSFLNEGVEIEAKHIAFPYIGKVFATDTYSWSDTQYIKILPKLKDLPRVAPKPQTMRDIEDNLDKIKFEIIIPDQVTNSKKTKVTVYAKIDIADEELYKKLAQRKNLLCEWYVDHFPGIVGPGSFEKDSTTFIYNDDTQEIYSENNILMTVHDGLLRIMTRVNGPPQFSVSTIISATAENTQNSNSNTGSP